MSLLSNTVQKISQKISTQNKRTLIYGCYGYTAELILKQIQQHKIQDLFIIAGRSQSKVNRMREKYQFERSLCFSLTEVDEFLQNPQIITVLNCAGPFGATAVVIARACVKYGKNYIDISGEDSTYEELYSKEFANAKSVTILTGAAYHNLPAECLCVSLSKAFEQKHGVRPTSIEIAYSDSSSDISVGIVKTRLSNFNQPNSIRKDSKIIHKPKWQTKKSFMFPSQNTPTECCSITMGDAYPLYKSTKIPNISGYIDICPPPAFIVFFVTLLLKIPYGLCLLFCFVDLLRERGPSEYAIRTCKGIDIVAHVSDGERTMRGDIHIPQGLQFTAAAALLAALKISAGEGLQTGAVTCTQALGEDVWKEIEGVIMNI
jgi:short subunit dehydrogenase-like uncharacterized protein